MGVLIAFKDTKKFFVSLNDHEVISRVKSLPKKMQARVIEQALKKYLSTPEGIEIFAILDAERGLKQ